MLDLVTQNDAAYVFRFLFVCKLSRVHADDYQLIRVLVLEPFQIRNDMHAVDAAIGPKVQQDHFAFNAASKRGLSVLSQPRPPFNSGARTRAFSCYVAINEPLLPLDNDCALLSFGIETEKLTQ